MNNPTLCRDWNYTEKSYYLTLKIMREKGAYLLEVENLVGYLYPSADKDSLPKDYRNNRATRFLEEMDAMSQEEFDSLLVMMELSR